MHHWRKFGENVSKNLQDITQTMFRDAHMDEQDKTIMTLATPLGGGLKSTNYKF